MTIRCENSLLKNSTKLTALNEGPPSINAFFTDFLPWRLLPFLLPFSKNAHSNNTEDWSEKMIKDHVPKIILNSLDFLTLLAWLTIGFFKYFFFAAVKVAWRFSHITKSSKFAVDEFCCFGKFWSLKKELLWLAKIIHVYGKIFQTTFYRLMDWKN